ncbi:MetQ/NlpA family ABC transporter substrate-binding protein [Enterococcus rivorum]|uniref:NLPA lipoprotein n=1 Tax=Enterococcus rivorum TaxID=762845 RepID=A0A1E5L1P8_9ENTE|nr:MetQ/NlpA family ABC transporter substrate-binding protein [Enterococcus rivorum]MBP2097712.1 D-methionine transport system substrate-binding protein [Enterococcus rivorum]OEH83983.1 NLPA lipoprotein [Enterococcus rivorum]
MKKVVKFFGVMMVLFLLGACTIPKNEESNEEKKKIKIACNQVSEIVLNAAKKDMEEKGYAPEFVVFSNNIESLEAVNSGDVDAAFAQHKPFVQSFNQQKNGDLELIKPYVYYTGIGLYSDKYKKLEEIPDNAKIAIMNDAMNRDNALKMLQDAGLISLTSDKKTGYTILDIEKNPKNIEFIEIEQAQTVRSLEDLDGAVCFFTFMFKAGRDFNDYLVRDQNASEFPSSLIVKKENADKKWAEEMNASLLTERSKKAINDHFKGVYTFYEN